MTNHFSNSESELPGGGLPGSALTDPLAQEARYRRFVEYLSRNELMIRRFVRSQLPSSDGVDDVVQDTALECWNKYAQFESGEEQKDSLDFIRWACVIARFKAMSWRRDRARDRLSFDEDVLGMIADTAVANCDQWEPQRQALSDCLKQMEKDSERLILSVHVSGDSIARIAKEKGLKARKLYSKLNVLRSLLMDCISQKSAIEAME
ncbi:RNA polymerase sigma-70 factor, ECF subfamily [Neorhodopirellula lusitana]|uniref:RNA polymerase sigma-70 factor, ECF subfamily n=1 Tax=Neorhodopirellula lusitana TaxID=445327 RepID=A0ABY1PRP3_9BACT|nr:sigma factor [Neorhodopirellula lusitana]SMP44021.1 RNA polymerase sigma-70 factor, ECF subfamily [Neorhodopirellula lusitana]